MLWRVIEREVVPTSRELGISQVVWSPIAQGVLTGKYRPGEQPPEGSRATDDKGGADMISRWMRDDVLTRVQQLQPIAEEAGLSMAALAVAWVLQNDNVATAIIGASRPEQVHDNVTAAGVRLPADVLARIDEILEPVIERDPAKTLESSPKMREARPSWRYTGEMEPDPDPVAVLRRWEDAGGVWRVLGPEPSGPSTGSGRDHGRPVPLRRR